MHYSRVSPDIFYNLEAADPADVLAKLADSKNAADALASYTPQHPQYKALKAKLAEARGTETNGPVRIPAGATLKFDAKKPMQDSRVPLLRERLGSRATRRTRPTTSPSPTRSPHSRRKMD